MERQQSLEEHYRRLGDQAEDFRNKNLIELVCSLVEGPDVLDIGSGTGALLSRLAQLGHRRVLGLEPSEELVAQTRRLRPGLEVFCGTTEALSPAEGLFDSITMIDVLEHIEDDRRQLVALFERLRPGGRLILLVPAHPILYAPRDRLYGHHRRYTRIELVTKLEQAGFEVERLRSWNIIGWLPFLVWGRFLGRVGGDGLRYRGRKNPLQQAVTRLLDRWYRWIENRYCFGFGLSLICTAIRPGSTPVRPTPARLTR